MRPDHLAILLLASTILVLIFGDFTTRVVFAALLAPVGGKMYWKILELGGRKALMAFRDQLLSRPEADAHTPLTPQTLQDRSTEYQ